MASCEFLFLIQQTAAIQLLYFNLIGQNGGLAMAILYLDKTKTENRKQHSGRRDISVGH
jgi:hypothetical protein